MTTHALERELIVETASAAQPELADGWYQFHPIIVMRYVDDTRIETYTQKETALKAFRQLSRRSRRRRVEIRSEIDRLEQDLTELSFIRDVIDHYCKKSAPIEPIEIPLTFKYGPNHPIIDINAFKEAREIGRKIVNFTAPVYMKEAA